jgi:uncharacterized membrane protein YciS (DUF1049 family)
MYDFAVSPLTEPVFGVLALLGAALVAFFFSRDGFRHMRAERKQQELRQRQRQQFWGYD